MEEEIRSCELKTPGVLDEKRGVEDIFEDKAKHQAGGRIVGFGNGNGSGSGNGNSAM